LGLVRIDPKEENTVEMQYIVSPEAMKNLEAPGFVSSKKKRKKIKLEANETRIKRIL
jgi:hypothetical protein